MLFHIEQQPPDSLAVIDDTGHYSYAELCADARRIGKTTTRQLGFALCRNTYASLCGYVGFLSHGGVPLLLPSELQQERLDNLLTTYRPAWLWIPIEREKAFPGFQRELELAGYVFLRRSDPASSPSLNEDLALLLTTSGSTGSPKLVRQTLHNINANTASIIAYLELDRTERPITTLPMHYTYGLSILNSHLTAGSTLLLTEHSLIQKPFWDFFHHYAPTSFGGVPYTYTILKRIGFFAMPLPSLRTFTQAGGRLDPDMHRQCATYAAEQGKRFYVMYGQTEATARMGYLPWRMAAEKCGSMGITIPGGHFSLIAPDGSVITTPDTVGELVYQGENVTPGYAECAEDLLCGDERHGTLLTGDMAQCDADGCYQIVGRKKRFLKMYGNRINLDECEQLIRAQFPGLDCACFGEDDLMRIAVTDATLCDPVRGFCAATLGLRRNSFTLQTVPRIPRNEAGKILYVQLEQGEHA